MENFSDSEYDCWLSRVRNIEQLFNITPTSYCKNESVNSIIKKRVKSIYDRFWLDEVQKVKADINGVNHNKLRL